MGDAFEVGRGGLRSDGVCDRTVLAGTPEGCCPQAATFEHGCILPARAMSTPYSASFAMGGFLM